MNVILWYINLRMSMLSMLIIIAQVTVCISSDCIGDDIDANDVMSSLDNIITYEPLRLLPTPLNHVNAWFVLLKKTSCPNLFASLFNKSTPLF